MSSRSDIGSRGLIFTTLRGIHSASHSKIHGLRFLSLRFFSVWGASQRPDLALECFRRKIEAGETVVIHGDGSQPHEG